MNKNRKLQIKKKNQQKQLWEIIQKTQQNNSNKNTQKYEIWKYGVCQNIEEEVNKVE